MMRTVKKLLQMDGRVYVFLKDEKIRKKFLEDAGKEGFTFGDGTAPEKRKETDSIYALNRNMTINFVGFAGHMAFRNADEVGGRKLIRIDYERYVSGLDEYDIMK